MDKSLKLKKHGHRAVSRQDSIYYTIVNIICTILFLIVLYPIVYIVSSSFSDVSAVQQGKVVFLPVDFSLDGYTAVFKDENLIRGFLNTVFITVVGTAFNLIVTVTCAYAMARRSMPGRNLFTVFFTITMFFGGGMIPSYILLRDLGMLNNYTSLIIPGAMSLFNMILVRTYIQSNIPESLLEASQIDGCNDFQFFFKVILPLSKPVIAVITLYYCVGHWNSFFSALIYIKDPDLMPLQIVLRQILILNQVDPNTIYDPEVQAIKEGLADLMKYSLIIVSSAPMLALYPFIQKHFVKGVMVGSIKG